MQIRRAILSMILMAVAGLAGAESRQSSADAGATSASVAAVKPIPAKQVVVYYFHGDARCQNCLRIEEYTKAALSTLLQAEVNSGAVEWRMVNYDKKQNAHFATDYQLITKSVVLVNLQDGKQVSFKNLPDIWQLLGDKDKFMRYIEKEVRAAQRKR